jgi:hypothetical protein
MDSYDFDVCLTPAARELLRPGEAELEEMRRAIQMYRSVYERLMGG